MKNTIAAGRETILRSRTMEKGMVERDTDDEVSVCIIYCLTHYRKTGMDIR